jgi:hypothetical protein
MRGRPKKDPIAKAIDLAVVEEDDGILQTELTAEGDIPSPTDEGWSDFVKSRFRPDELEQDKPTVDGLRRVTELLLGPIVRAVPTIVQAPNDKNGFHAVVSFEVAVAWGGDWQDVRTFGDSADVYPGNTDPAFARFATATATTRAEGRALRKALKLRKVVTAEEITTVPVSDSGVTGFIAGYQEKGIEKLCRDLDININKLISKGEFKVKRISHMTSDMAIKLFELLNKYLQNSDKIPENVRGFDPGWRSNNE